MSLFKLIEGVTNRKVAWDKQPTEIQKAMSSFMMTRWLSMDSALTDFVSGVSRYTSAMSPRACYDFFHSTLPSQKFYFKYIKGEKSDTFDSEVISLLCKVFPINKAQAVRYSELLVEGGTWEEDIVDLCERYGFDKKAIKKMLKVKKPPKKRAKK
jgi:hypothetical protein